jgi:hypothetical protein
MPVEAKAKWVEARRFVGEAQISTRYRIEPEG